MRRERRKLKKEEALLRKQSYEIGFIIWVFSLLLKFCLFVIIILCVVITCNIV